MPGFPAGTVKASLVYPFFRMSSQSPQRPRKRQTQSCDRCKFKKRKCDGSTPCENCLKVGADCTFNISQKKRGPKSSRQPPEKKLKLDDNATFSGQVWNSTTAPAGLDPEMLNLYAELNPKLLAEFSLKAPVQIDPEMLSLYQEYEPKSLDSNFMSLLQDQQQVLHVDPEILNLYAQINPKLSIQQDFMNLLEQPLGNVEDILYGTLLSVPDLPQLNSDFYIHLISLFFTYFHATMPIFEESIFFRRLMPVNTHDPSLLFAIYSIGCKYSRTPQLFHPPLMTPNDASKFFRERSILLRPKPGEILSPDRALQVAQAGILLANCDIGLSDPMTLPIFRSSVQFIHDFDFMYEQVSQTRLKFGLAVPKQNLECTMIERKRHLFNNSGCAGVFYSLTCSLQYLMESPFILMSKIL